MPLTWGTGMLLPLAVSVLAAVTPGIPAAQDVSAAPIPTPGVADSTRVATAATVQNSLQTAQQVLQQGQALQFQMLQLSAVEQLRALNRR